MLNVNIIYVGELREKYFCEAVAEYEKRLSAYCRISNIKIKEEQCSDNASAAETEAAIAREGEKILAALPKGKRVALCVEGKQLSSVRLAEKLEKAMASGMSDLNLIIGGARGLSEAVKKTCDVRLSVSEMTFTHRLMRVIVLEALYRSFSIISGSKYNK